MKISKNTKADLKFEKVMSEYGRGKLTSHGSKVDNQKQALAIAFSEARKINPAYGNKENVGNIKNEYQGKSDSKIWDEWTPKQRKDFLIDHESFIKEDAKIHCIQLPDNIMNQIKSDYASLPGPIKDQLFFNVYAGKYSKGAKLATPVKISSGKSKLNDRIQILKSSLSKIKSASGKKVIQDKISKLESESNRSVKERIESGKGKFYMDVPTEYAKPIYRKLWSMNIKPELHALNGNTKVVVTNGNNLSKAYKIYSDILTDKGGMPPSMAKITGKV